MKVLIIIAILGLVSSSVIGAPHHLGPIHKRSTPSTQQPIQKPVPKIDSINLEVAKPETPRAGRYLILENGSALDTINEIMIPADAQYVVQRGAGSSRDVYIRTVPLRTVEVVSTV